MATKKIFISYTRGEPTYHNLMSSRPAETNFEERG